MKNLLKTSLAIFALTALLSSCKKEYTCCEYSTDGTAINENGGTCTTYSSTPDSGSCVIETYSKKELEDIETDSYQSQTKCEQVD